MLKLGAAHCDISGLDLSCLQLRLRLGYIGLHRNAPGVPVGRHAQCFLILHNRIVQQLLLRVGRAQLKVIQRHLSLQR